MIILVCRGWAILEAQAPPSHRRMGTIVETWKELETLDHRL
jgi:hypothetical protein